MPKIKEDKPKIGDLVETNPNIQKLKEACEEHVSTFQQTGETLLTWSQPKIFAEQYGFRNFCSDSFRSAYYKVRSLVEGKIIAVSFF